MVYFLIEFIDELIFGLNVAIWLLLTGPIALFIGLPRRSASTITQQ